MAYRATVIGLLLGAGLAVAAGAAFAETADSGYESFDCVVKPKAVVELGSPDQGIIAELTVDRGDLVEKGEVVARLDSEIQALGVELAKLKAESDVEVRSNEARVEFRDTETERAQTLHDREIVSTKILDEAAIERRLAVLALETARLQQRMSQVELAHAKTLLERRSIRSPVKGVVVELATTVGQFVYEQTHIMKIAEIDPLYVEVFVPAQFYDSIEVGTAAEVGMEAPIGGVYLARVSVVDRVFDPASRTFGVRLELPNADYALPAGLTCDIRFLPVEAGAGDVAVDSDFDMEEPGAPE